MAIGNNIKRLRNLKGMTQKELGLAIGFDNKTADVRIAQYESGTRTPKENLIEDIALVLKVTPEAITTPNIDSYIGVMHTLFAVEDMYGVSVSKSENGLSLNFEINNRSSHQLSDRINDWASATERFSNGEITKEEYNEWRYNYPKIEVERSMEKVRSKAKKQGKE